MATKPLIAKVNFSLITGLPASGKSTFSKLICEQIKSSNLDMIILPVQFDDLLKIPSFFEAEASNSESLPELNPDDLVWKRTREHVRVAILFIARICLNSYNKNLELNGSQMIDFIQLCFQNDINNAESLFLSKDFELDIICKLLFSIIKSFSSIYNEINIPEVFTKTSITDVVNEFIRWHRLLVEASATGLGTLILLDDNFFYSSMRHEYYKIARTCTCS